MASRYRELLSYMDQACGKAIRSGIAEGRLKLLALSSSFVAAKPCSLDAQFHGLNQPVKLPKVVADTGHTQ